ncbi:calcium-binding protein CML25 [Spatholobus suberectus]|nr:calcium-binding protein CML25 [Spatholobus suberectus]
MGLRSLFHRKKKLLKTTSSSSFPTPPLPSRAPVTDELEYVFKKFDANGDGRISSSELGAMMRSLGQPATEEELCKMIREVDSDGDGHIGLEEFVELNTKGVDPDEVLENLKDAFSIFDVDGNGSITAEELHVVMASLGDQCSLEECRKMIAGVDGDGDGMISFEEFKKMMTGNK